MPRDEYYAAYPEGLPSNRYGWTVRPQPEIRTPKPTEVTKDIPTGNPSIDEGIWTGLIDTSHYRDAAIFAAKVTLQQPENV